MQQKIGTILIIGGVLSAMFYGYHYYEQLNTFEAFGKSITIDSGNPTPVIVSVCVVILGILISRFNRK
ncbi:hypothetical protein AB2B38_006835 [Balneola sp. MJW-20]|uniref:hypothetical protein n=1 Tax=Gracilimonas aurantiaca TaxID=3234185 RepID=UPI0034679FCC